MSNNIKILKNFILYFLVFIIVCIYGITHASALTYESAEGYQNNITVVLVAPDYSNTPINVPINSQLAFNQVREVIVQVNNFNFVANRNYQLELYLPQQDLGRANFYTVQGANGESCLVSYDNSAFDGEFPRWAFQCPNSTNNITIDIKNSNNQILWDNGPNGAPIFTWGYSYLRYSSTSLSGSGIGTDDIINNQNQNTQNIINNQNQNTQNIQDTINDNFNNCLDASSLSKSLTSVSLFTSGKYVSSTSNSAVLFDVSKFVGKSITINFSDLDNSLNIRNNFCFTNSLASSVEKNCLYYNITSSGVSSTSFDALVPNDAKYLYVVGYVGSNVTSLLDKITLSSSTYCFNRLDEQYSNINDDDTTDAQNKASDFFESFTTETFGLTSIITAPLNLIRSVLNSSCTTLQLPLPYLDNRNLELPCMSSIYSQYFGTFFTIYQTITYGIIAYWVCVRIFNQVKDFKNPEHDEIEVMDL